MSIIIIEGLDRLGKSTLINNIQQHQGFHQYIHYEKPQKLKVYDDNLQRYQYQSFVNGFNLISASLLTDREPNIIFDRFHLGETVYSPLYRRYSGSYVFDLEKECIHKTRMADGNHRKIKMILLISSNFDFIQDDGLSFDIKNREIEQEAFMNAFQQSCIVDKRVIDVYDSVTGGFRDPIEIYQEAMK